jgi:hypothetical protein
MKYDVGSSVPVVRAIYHMEMVGFSDIDCDHQQGLIHAEAKARNPGSSDEVLILNDQPCLLTWRLFS